MAYLDTAKALEPSPCPLTLARSRSWKLAGFQLLVHVDDGDAGIGREYVIPIVEIDDITFDLVV
jgi:hypothetical protein